MFQKIKADKFLGGYESRIAELREALKNADAVIIGAGSGLSSSAGFTYSGERFNKYFKDFQIKYGFEDMYTGGFYKYKTPEEYWAYWSRYIYINRYIDPPNPVYNELYNLVKNKDYFVLTTNVDHCFQKAGFDKKRLFYTQGDYGLFQCSTPCCNETFDNREIVLEMVEKQQNMHIPRELVPVCPRCGRPMTTNLRADDKFVQDEGWNKAAERYSLFIRRHKGMTVLYLELGVGYNTPGIIKYPFWQMTYSNTKAIYACINCDAACAPSEILSRSVCINEDIGKVIKDLIVM